MEHNGLEPNALYLVATPIGNLSDLSHRAEEVLRMADFIAAEDTRHTLKLLNHLGIKKPMVSYFEHNKRERGLIITDRIAAGQTCALVTDAGTPAISDPGEDIVALCAQQGIRVIPIPGPCAFVQALIVSGLSTKRFAFEGFLSVSKTARKEHLQKIKEDEHTLVFYEAPHKLATTLQDLYQALGDRKIALVRELTKIHEEVVRTTLSQAAERYREEKPKGEFVLVVEGYVPPAEEASASRETVVAKVHQLIEEGLDQKEATKQAALFFHLPKRQVYRYLLEEKEPSR